MAKKKRAPTWKQLSTFSKFLVGCAGVFWIILVLNITKITVPNNQNANNHSQSKDSSTSDMSAAESYCQDASLLNKYINVNNVSIVSVFDYKPQYSDSGYVDSSNRPIMILQWNGKNKDTGETLRFKCGTTSQKDNLELHWLRVNDSDLYKSAEFKASE